MNSQTSFLQMLIWNNEVCKSTTIGFHLKLNVYAMGQYGSYRFNSLSNIFTWLSISELIPSGGNGAAYVGNRICTIV